MADRKFVTECLTCNTSDDEILRMFEDIPDREPADSGGVTGQLPRPEGRGLQLSA